jgi:hypothetical protein
MARVSDSMRMRGERRSDQGEVWADVADKVLFCRAESPTRAMSDAYDASAQRLEGYSGAFRAEPGQRGAIAAIDGKAVGLELFDATVTFAKYLEKLVRSYALDALETADGSTVTPKTIEAEQFLSKLKKASAERFAALGEGEDIRLTGKGIAGGALAARGRIVHLAGFAVAP